MEPVLLIGHDKDETFGVALPALDAAGIPHREHRAGTADVLPGSSDVSGVIVFGGEMNVDMTDRYPFLTDERAFSREAVDRGIPYLGICLGAQMLARALDRRVFPAATKEIGFNVLHPMPEAQDDPLLSHFDDGDRVFHWHEDTFELPEGAVLLATGDDVPMQAYRVGDRAWGLQFHFEVDRPEVELWLKSAGDNAVEPYGKTIEQVLEESDRYLDAQETRARAVFGGFADQVRRAAESRS